MLRYLIILTLLAAAGLASGVAAQDPPAQPGTNGDGDNPDGMSARVGESETVVPTWLVFFVSKDCDDRTRLDAATRGRIQLAYRVVRHPASVRDLDLTLVISQRQPGGFFTELARRKLPLPATDDRQTTEWVPPGTGDFGFVLELTPTGALADRAQPAVSDRHLCHVVVPVAPPQQRLTVVSATVRESWQPTDTPSSPRVAVLEASITLRTGGPATFASRARYDLPDVVRAYDRSPWRAVLPAAGDWSRWQAADPATGATEVTLTRTFRFSQLRWPSRIDWQVVRTDGAGADDRASVDDIDELARLELAVAPYPSLRVTPTLHVPPAHRDASRPPRVAVVD